MSYGLKSQGEKALQGDLRALIATKKTFRRSPMFYPLKSQVAKLRRDARTYGGKPFRQALMFYDRKSNRKKLRQIEMRPLEKRKKPCGAN